MVNAQQSVNSKKRGIYIGLSLVLIVYLIFGWLMPNVIKWSIEAAGAEITGAEVNLADVSLSYIPLGVTLTGMQVTDARQPDNNLFQFDQAQVELDWLALLSGQTVVDQLTVSAIALDQPSNGGHGTKTALHHGISSEPIFKSVFQFLWIQKGCWIRDRV